MNYFYNNFLSLDKINEVYDTIFNIDFPFFYAHENTVSKPDLNKEEKNFSNILDYYQICHVFYSKYSEYSYIPNMIIEKLNIPNKILRAKVNFQGQNIKATTETYNCPHTDTDKPHLAAIYYVNDSDGFTFLFDNNNNIINRIVPKKGSLLLFDGSIKHASGHPIKSLKRCVINFNLTK
mgnify:CR=1 FL=1|tara:strand:+ start:120 stop:656 length:537 start_codon:yes stop_codon:yes gene_type:complete